MNRASQRSYCEVVTAVGFFFALVVFTHAATVYVSNEGVSSSQIPGSVIKFDSSGSVVTSRMFTNSPQGLAVDSSGNLYVATGGGGTVLKYDSSGNESIFASGLGFAAGLAFDSGGYLYAEDDINHTIVKFDSGGNGSTFASGLAVSSYVLTLDNSGNVYVANFLFNFVYRIDSSGSGSVFPAGLALDQPSGLAVDSNGYLYVANARNGTINKFDSSGNGSVFASALNSPYGLAFDDNGNLYVATHTGEIDVLAADGSASMFATGAHNQKFIAVTDVPEPTTWVSVAVGVCALSVFRIRHRSQHPK
jgi:sugar lactone lactonase YvrE